MSANDWPKIVIADWMPRDTILLLGHRKQYETDEQFAKRCAVIRVTPNAVARPEEGKK